MPQLATTEAELEAIYGSGNTPVATIKEIDHISDHYRMFVDASPFVVVATAGPEGLDCTPRGDPADFVRVADRHTVMLPDRRGNNRIDTLHNLVRDPRISLLFLIPGIGRTLRINGRAVIRIDLELRETFKMEGKIPRSVIVVTVERAYTQCPRALIRSGGMRRGCRTIAGSGESHGTRAPTSSGPAHLQSQGLCSPHPAIGRFRQVG